MKLLFRTLVFLLTGFAVSDVEAQTKVDISLEGPWILYVDISKSIQPWPVLVLTSPGGVSADGDQNYFHTIALDNGDGYPVEKTGVYCLAFDNTCTPTPPCYKTSSCSNSPSWGNYPQTVPPLPVTVSSSWDWSHQWLSPTYATVFILPMPDYFSTDTGWFVRFNSKYQKSGHDYKPYDGKPMYATGLELHYENGPAQFSLADCTPSSAAKLNMASCSSLANTDISNIGALHLRMRSPESDNACDPHVRRAYPKMIGLLDGDNPKLQVIDLAKGLQPDGKTPLWDSEDIAAKEYRCLDHDDQSSGQKSAQRAKVKFKDDLTRDTMAVAHSAWTNQFTNLASAIDQIEACIADSCHQFSDPQLFLEEIKSVQKSIDVKFPRFSQLDLLRTLLRQSSLRLSDLLALSASGAMGGTRADVLTRDNVPPTPTLSDLYKIEIDILKSAAIPSKSGNDCKAVLMLAQ